MSQELTCKCTCDALVQASQVPDAGTKMLMIGGGILVLMLFIFLGVIIYNGTKIKDDGTGGYY